MEENPFHFDNVPLRTTSFRGLKKSSYYITMRDGIKIAIEVDVRLLIG